MSGREDTDDDGGFASPPCFLHEVDPLYAGLAPKTDARQRRDVLRWRKSTREMVLTRRLALDSRLRRNGTEQIARRLDAVLGSVEGLCIGLYSPFRGEPDLRSWLEGALARGATAALPVVETPRAPMAFRSWRPGDALVPGVWNIPVPAKGVAVQPDIVVAPLVGFDAGCYRLGYGGGYYDRTLAVMPQRPRAIGVGFALGELGSIYPLPHDVPMDIIVTEEGVRRRSAA